MLGTTTTITCRNNKNNNKNNKVSRRLPGKGPLQGRARVCWSGICSSILQPATAPQPPDQTRTHPGEGLLSHFTLTVVTNKPGGTMQKSGLNKQTFRCRIGYQIGCRNIRRISGLLLALWIFGICGFLEFVDFWDFLDFSNF